MILHRRAPRLFTPAFTFILLAAASFALTACETTPLHPRDEAPDNPGVTTEIGKPLAVVNQAMPAAVESCGFEIDKRQFVDGIVILEAMSRSGMRVSIQLSSLDAERTQVVVRPQGDEPEGLMLQMVAALRNLVWN